MKIKLLFLFTLIMGVATKMSAQVEDVNIFVAPTAGYNWFDSKTTVEDGLMYGVTGGFGFGKGIELRGIYETSSNLRQDFGKYESDLDKIGIDVDFPDRDVKVTRMGGEFKANIPIKNIAPYLLLGTGVQKFKRSFEEENFKTETLYGSGGLGLKFNLSKRLTFNIEGRAFGYNMKADNLLIDPDNVDNDDYDEWVEDQGSRTMWNFGLNAGLQLYLGGTNEDNLSSLDKAYRQRFSSGLSDFKVTLAPVGAYLDFNGKSGYRDTYMLGAELGLDFTDYVGIKGYYMKATEDEKVSFDFDKLSMYGGDFVGRLNIARGIVPYITVGGGYLDVHNDYLGELENPYPASSYFAKGGLGLDIPLGRNVELFGSANILYTLDDSDSKVSDVVDTDELRRHNMYTAGVRVKLGKKAETSDEVDKAFDERFDPEREAYEGEIEDYDQRVDEYDEKLKERDKKIEAYEREIEDLEEELAEAFRDNDEQRASEIMKRKKSLETQIEEAEDYEPENPLIRMSPAELESLIDKVLMDVEKEAEEKSVNERLDRMEQLLLNLNKGEGVDLDESKDAATAAEGSSDVSANDRLVEEISKLQQKVNDQDNTIKDLRTEGSKSSDGKSEIAQAIESSQDQTGSVSSSSGYNLSKGFALYVGPTFGDASNFNIGGRWYHAFSNTRLMLMPEAYVALGGSFGFGLNANGVLPFETNTKFSPYVGLGVGVNYLNSKFRVNPNFIVGTGYQLTDTSSLFVDFTVRGAFKNNQLGIGYRFNF